LGVADIDECGCDPDCWCRRTAIGRLLKWWFPARYFRYVGLRHRNGRLEEWKRSQPPGSLEAWKRERGEGVDRMVERQPNYESLVRLGSMRFGMTVKLANGETGIHELGRPGLNQSR